MPTRSCQLLAFASMVLACSTEDDRKPLTRQQLLDPESCKDCHPKHYQEWSSSMHAYASLDPVFLAMNRRGQEEAQLGEFCVQCHAPMAFREGAIRDYADLSDVPKHLQGVTCYFCHNAIAADEPHNNANIRLANDDVMRGALHNPLRPYAHDVAYSRPHDSTQLESSYLCGTCHDIETPNGFHLERTLDEYLKSTAALPGPDFQSCQDCHMKREDTAMTAAEYPGVVSRTVHSHLFPAVDVALTPDWPNQEAMRMAVEKCELQQRSLSGFQIVVGDALPHERFDFSVQLETQVAHNMPSGAASDRRMWVEVVAFDAEGHEVLRTDEIEDGELEIKPEPDPMFCVFRDRILDAGGNETHMFWEAASRDLERSRALLPQMQLNESHTYSCPYTTDVPVAEPPARIDVRVRLRPMGVDVLQDLVGSGHLDPVYIERMPTFTVVEARFEYDVALREYRGFYLSEDDCDGFVELLERSRAAL